VLGGGGCRSGEGIEINSHFILGEEAALPPAPHRSAVGDYYNVVVIIINIAAGVRVYRACVPNTA